MVADNTWDLSLSGLAPPPAVPTMTLILMVHSAFNFNYSNFLKLKHVFCEFGTIRNETPIPVAARTKV